MDNDFATGYALGADSGNNNNCCNNGGFWGDNGWWTLILFARIFGYGIFGGWGGFGGGGSAGAQGAITRSNLWSEFAFNDLQRNVQGIQQGLCDGFYAVNSTLLNGFNGVNTTVLQGFNGVQAGQAQLANQIASCCCDTSRQIERGSATLAIIWPQILITLSSLSTTIPTGLSRSLTIWKPRGSRKRLLRCRPRISLSSLRQVSLTRTLILLLLWMQTLRSLSAESILPLFPRIPSRPPILIPVVGLITTAGAAAIAAANFLPGFP